MTLSEVETKKSSLKQKDYFLSQKSIIVISKMTFEIKMTFEMIKITFETEIQIEIENMLKSINIMKKRHQSNENDSISIV